MLLWFRNDLRCHDNPALQFYLSNRSVQTSGKALFFISEKQWAEHNWSAIKVDFIKRHAQALKRQLQALNIELQLVEVDDFKQQVEYLQNYCHKQQISEVIANQELELNERKRDEALSSAGIKLRLFEADVIVPKGKLLTQAGQMFQKFTPFKRAWLDYVRERGFEYFPPYPALQAEPMANKELEPKSLSSAWPLSEDKEQNLAEFFSVELSLYAQQRDYPAIRGSSKLSPYLATGTISVRFLLWRLLMQYPDLLIATDCEEFAWLNELIWRDFYRHILFARQDLCKYQCYKKQYQHLAWPNNKPLFEAWCQGRTGYPLVDAAMRQLLQTGWMHNRLRMVVASFLSKHLLIDWRWGERFFMQQLIDGDFAANNGGWQWAASTGCDAQPYFRIFNPIRQSEKFDPNGDFIRMYLPELATVPAKHIHFPHEYLAAQGQNGYWPAIVEHKQARLAALDFYKV